MALSIFNLYLSCLVDETCTAEKTRARTRACVRACVHACVRACVCVCRRVLPLRAPGACPTDGWLSWGICSPNLCHCCVAWYQMIEKVDLNVLKDGESSKRKEYWFVHAASLVLAYQMETHVYSCLVVSFALLRSK